MTSNSGLNLSVSPAGENKIDQFINQIDQIVAKASDLCQICDDRRAMRSCLACDRRVCIPCGERMNQGDFICQGCISDFYRQGNYSASDAYRENVVAPELEARR